MVIILSNTEAMLKLKKLSIILFVTFFSFQISSEIIFTKEYKYSEVRINTDPYYDLEIVTHNKDKEIDMEIKILGLNVNLLEKLNLSEEKETVESFCSKYSSLCRIANELYIVPAINDSTSFGKGLGAGTAAVAIYNNFTFYNLGETENQRIVRELGYIFGTFLYITKILIVIILNVFALLKFRDKNKLIFTPILVFTSVQLCLGAITYTTSFISFIFWFSLGILFLSFNKDKNFYK